jgi:predicted Rossmann fold flavoprotein
VWDVLVDDLKKYNVTVRSRAEASELITEGSKVTGIKLKSGEVIEGKNIILATGGMSRPETGSTGDGFKMLAKIGHTVVEPSTALVPVTTSDEWSHAIAGVSLPNAKITLFQDGKKEYSDTGKFLFTHVGISGPVVLNASATIGEYLSYGDVLLELDIVPHFSYDTLNFKLQELFKTHSNKKLKNALDDLVPGGLIEPLASLSGIDFDTASHSVSREARLKLVKLLKHIPLHPTGLLGTDKAIITAGGVALEEVDFKTMRSRKFENLYIVGDLLNINRPSGGAGPPVQ